MRIRTVFVGLLVAPAALLALPGTATAGGGGCHQPRQTSGAGVEVQLLAGCMTPTVLEVEPGADVTFVNRDPYVHNVWGVGWGGETLDEGDAFIRTFDRPGTYPFTCTLHPGMSGAVVVGGGTALSTQPIASATDDGSSAALLALTIGLVALTIAGGAGIAWVRRETSSADDSGDGTIV